MRWLTLYARSRRLPASLVALVLCPLVIRVLAGSDWSVGFASLALGAAIAVAATGLSGQDVDLDRTAAFGWLPRRLVHLVLLGVIAVGVLLLVRASEVPAPVILRDGLGLVGLAGLAAFAFGGQFGWTLPLLWLVVALFVPGDPVGLYHVVAWPLQDSDIAVSWWLAGGLFLVGTGAYAAVGARR
ncbi:hypothetical protein VSH64_30760 [Amycolatopsis rhabdoformis]|uniref:ABC transporter permease n=1 Tax=Amycolatopsis rhabdoformis TaxID=1448059 RepID=A0ABZ1I0S6_9PSEU|nr:hypothetical protein [Amycolatopsis rhabdoformis]WSE27235.1 hypothetical protein VSH64_30760 [Amycolatopsis rhabdoformis]